MFFRFKPRQDWQEKVVERVFKDRKLVVENLVPFGFVPRENGFSYRAALLGGMVSVEFEIGVDGAVRVEVREAGEKEVLRLSQRSSSSFLSRQLRKEYEEELWHVAERCFEPDVFRHELTRRLIAHVRTLYGDELEHLWRRSPENAIVRRRDNEKWYAAFLVIPRLKLTGDSKERTEVLNLRVEPGTLEGCVDHVSRFPGYHMNKKNWVSLCLDGSVPFEELAERLDTSYRLALK